MLTIAIVCGGMAFAAAQQENNKDPERLAQRAQQALQQGDQINAQRLYQNALDLAEGNVCQWCNGVRQDLTVMLANHLFEAMNSHHYSQIRAFTAATLAEPTLQRIGLEMYAGYLAAESHFHGSFDLLSASVLEVNEGVVAAEVYVQSANTQMPYRIELSYTDSFPQKITRIRIRAHTDDSQFKVKPTVTEAMAQLAAYVDFLAAKDVFSGSVLIAQGDEVLLRKAVGMASKRFNAPVNLDTRFNLGSMNKMFTSVAILQLVESGKLKLTDKLIDILPLKRHDTLLAQVEIQHLLSHTSGVGALNCPVGDDSVSADKALCLNSLADIELNFTPGTQYRYSNEGMYILGLVLEQLTGQSYYQVVRDNVFAKAGMNLTESLDLQFPVENAAIGYSFDGLHDQWRNNLFIHDKKGGPAGGGYSTVTDLFRFSRALQQYQLLGKSLTQLAMTPKTEFGAQNYGFGFIVWDRNGKPVVGHNGSFPGVSSQMEMYQDTEYTLIVLSNHSFGADPVLAKARQLLGL